MARSDLIDARVAKLTGGFGRYVRVYDDRVPYGGRQLAAHRECMLRRQKAGSVREAIEDAQFVDLFWQTLRAWGIGKRASRLVSVAQFSAALRSALPGLEALERLTIDGPDVPTDIGERLWVLIESLDIVENKAKIVAGTKALHHLLPDLVVPMDREWTGAFFQFHHPEWQDARQQKTFTLAYQQFLRVAQQVQPEQYVTGDGWRTCRTKILDNALIGFCKAELGTGPSAGAPGSEITVEVQDLPPAKDGADSIFSASHAHGRRVQALLEAAQQRLRERPDFVPVRDGPVVMEVVLYAPPGQVPGDATNYLGGIADVLEEKETTEYRRRSLDHLGELAGVWLYWNDKQIKQVSYREAISDHVHYRVIVRSSEPGRNAD